MLFCFSIFMELIFLTLIFAIFTVIFAYLFFSARKKSFELQSSKQSLSTKYGKMSEQFFPFMKDYPYDEHGFRFIGSPVDGVQFCDDKIVFVEFKASNSALSEKQRKIKELIKNKKVDFEEFRINKEE